MGIFAIITSNGVRRPSNAIRELEELDALTSVRKVPQVCDGPKFLTMQLMPYRGVATICFLPTVEWPPFVHLNRSGQSLFSYLQRSGYNLCTLSGVAAPSADVQGLEKHTPLVNVPGLGKRHPSEDVPELGKRNPLLDVPGLWK